MAVTEPPRWGEDVYESECRCGALPGQTHATDCLDLGPMCRGNTPDGPCDDEACEGHGSRPEE